MKSFSQFLKEAVETSASTQAKKLGLTGDGHGDWYDKDGTLVAKTVSGKLKFFGQGKKSKETDSNVETKKPTTSKSDAKTKTTVSKTEPKKVSQQKSGESETEADEEKPTSDGVVIVFGRFNPPTIGHEKLLNRAAKEAEKNGYDLKIYPSRSQDKKKNPLDAGAKIDYMRQMFPKYADSIVDDANSKTIFNVMIGANEGGYKNMKIMVGADRLGEFQGLSHKYNGELYNYDNLEVVSAGDRDPDAEGAEGMSASKLRLAASDGDFKSFAKGVPNTLTNQKKMELYNTLRKSMGMKEELETWEIAPKFDEESLRNHYIKENIYSIGTIVENINTGLRGKVLRRGTNYVIAVTEGDVMFKSWLRDLIEHNDKPHEVGTDEYREYVQGLTPGQKIARYNKTRVLPTMTKKKSDK
jgi:hypothetical protein|tara:strand:+ start:2151 stop:3386 length:1236 start_codon:yes stop_codon:yes gene_type:complete